MIAEEDFLFCHAVLQKLKSAPFDVRIPLQHDKPAYATTLKAIMQIQSHHIDKNNGFEIMLSSPYEFHRQPDNTPGQYHQRCEDNLSKTFVPGKDYQPAYFRKNHIFAQSRNTTISPSVTKETESPMAKTKEKLPAIITIPSDEVIMANYSAAKVQMETLVKGVAAITEIKTDDEATNLRNKKVELNNALKAIDTVRETIKAPFFQTGKTIDRIAKEIAAGADEEVKRSNKLLLDFDKEKQRVFAEQQAEAEKKRQETERIAKEALGDIDAKRNELKAKENEIYLLLVEEKVNPVKVYETHLKFFKPTVEEYGDLLPHANDMRARLLILGRASETFQVAKAKRGANSITENQMEDNRNIWVMEKSKYSLAKSRAFNETEAILEEKKEEVILNAEIEKSQATGAVMMNAPVSNVSVRKTLKFRVLNAEALPAMFAMVDEAKVKEWMKGQEFVEGEKVEGFVYVDMGNGTYTRKQVDALEFYFQETPY